MSDYASESGHFYDAITGEPRYRVTGANGVERDATLRDAKKHGWYPGFTKIEDCVYKWALENWKQEQAILAALTAKRIDGETDEALVARIRTDAGEQAKKAAARGTQIHAAVEAHYAGKPYDESCRPWVECIENLLTQTFGLQEWLPEKSFAHPLGYGSKVDLHSRTVLLDFKGKDKPYSKWETYDNHARQLAANIVGLRPHHQPTFDPVSGWPRAGIVFFDRAEPYAEWHEVKPAALERGWRQFAALLEYWKASNL